MKFTSVAVAALFLANSSAVLLQKQAKDDCGGKWCNKGLAYDLDEATLRKAEANDAPRLSISMDPPSPITKLPPTTPLPLLISLLRPLLMPMPEPPRPLLPLDSLELPPLTPTGPHTRVLEVPMRPLSTLRRLPLMLNSRPTIRMLRTASSTPERIETSLLPLLPRTTLMPTLRPTKIELPGRRINS